MKKIFFLLLVVFTIQVLFTIPIFAGGSHDYWYDHGTYADLDLDGDGRFSLSGSGNGDTGEISLPLIKKGSININSGAYYDFDVLAKVTASVESGGRIWFRTYKWQGTKFKSIEWYDNLPRTPFIIPAYYAKGVYIDAYDESSDDDQNKDYHYSIFYLIERGIPASPDAFNVTGNFDSEYVNPQEISFQWQKVVDDIAIGDIIDNFEAPASGIRYYTIKDSDTGEILKDSIDPTFDENDLVSTTLNIEEGHYNLVVYATDKAGNVGYDSVGLAVTVDGTGPGMVGNVQITGLTELSGADYPYLPVENGQLTLSWDAATDPEITPEISGSGVAGYRVYVDENEQTGLTIENYDDRYETTFTLSESLASGLHELKIVAVDGVGNEGSPSSISFYVDSSLPEAPADFTCTDGLDLDGVWYSHPGTTTLILSWNGSGLDGSSEAWESGFDHYAVQAQDQNGEWTEPISFAESPTTITVPEDETPIRVVAYDRVGNYAASEPLLVRALPDLAQVTVPTPCYFDVGDGYTLRWNSLETDPIGLGISEYRVIVRSEDEAAPAATDFDSVSGQSGTTFSLTNQPTAEYLVAYIQARSDADSDEYPHRSEGIIGFRLPPLVIDPPDGEEYVLEDDEYWWSGVHEVHGTVVVPAGRILGIESEAEIQIFGNSAIRIESDGKLETYGVSLGDISFGMGPGEVTGPGSWQGIQVYGTATVSGVSIHDAERGITILEGGCAFIQTTSLYGNEAGLHIYRGEATVNGCEIENNELYGIKEDEFAWNDPVITNTLFSGNGYDYYDFVYGLLSIEKLNEKTGNSGNVEK